MYKNPLFISISLLKLEVAETKMLKISKWGKLFPKTLASPFYLT